LEEFIDVFWWLLEQFGVSDWEVFAATAWSLWNNRNAVRQVDKANRGE